VGTRLVQDPAAVRGLGVVESDGEAVAGKQIADLMRSRRHGFTNQVPDL